MKAKRDVDGLIKAMDYQKDGNVRKGALNALAEIRDQRAVKPLVAALRESDLQVRLAAAEALGRTGDASAAEALIAVLKSDQYHFRLAAERALVAIGAPAVVHFLAALNDSNSFVRRVVAEILGRIADARSVKPLVAVLDDSEYPVCCAAAEALAKIGTPAVESLNAALKDSNRRAREAAAETLGKIGDARAVMPLIAALKDEDRCVRREAARALDKVGDTRAVAALVAALMDNDSGVCTAVAGALNRMGWQPGQDASGAAYWVARGEWEKCAELRMLAVKPLVVALNDWRNNVREKAADTLDKIGWRPSRDEGSAWYWIAKEDWMQCAQIGAPATGPLIATLGEQFSMRKGAAEVLVKLYHSGLLNEAQKRLILAERNRIIEPHTVVRSANDDERTGPSQIGIGVAFPM
jgi:HEAT repeat protein